jgi:hypothetical protein
MATLQREKLKVPSDPGMFLSDPPCGGRPSRMYVFLNRLDASSVELAFRALKLLHSREAQLFSCKPPRHFLGCVIDRLLRSYESDSDLNPESLGTLISV